MPADVFVSHSSADKDAAETICRTLEGRGLSCWLSWRDIGGGDSYQEAIVAAIDVAKVMVLVFSAHTNASREVAKEIGLASQCGLRVIPARIEDVKPSAALRYELVTRQWINLFGDDRNSQLERFGTLVAAHVGVPKAPATAEMPANDQNLVAKLLLAAEQRHLMNLHRGRTAKYEGQGALREELRRLRGLDLIRMKSGKTVAEIGDGRKIDLAHYVELTETGGTCAAWLVTTADVRTTPR